MNDLNHLNRAELEQLCQAQQQQLKQCHHVILSKRLSTPHRRLMRNCVRLCKTSMAFKDMANTLGISKRYCRELRRELENLGMVKAPHYLENRQKTAVNFAAPQKALVQIQALNLGVFHG